MITDKDMEHTRKFENRKYTPSYFFNVVKIKHIYIWKNMFRYDTTGTVYSGQWEAGNAHGPGELKHSNFRYQVYFAIYSRTVL